VELARALTDDEGIASVPFTPARPGDYVFTVEPARGAKLEEFPPPAPILLACRSAEAPLFVIDIDGTVVRSNFEQVLRDQAEPMAHSREVIRRVAKEHTVVYLTLRIDHLSRATRLWLEEHGYPRGPLLMGRFKHLFEGNRQYRTSRVAELTERFGAIRGGVGDKVSDAWAYANNDLPTYLLIDPQRIDEADDAEDLAEQVAELPEQVDVVTGWREAERAIFEAATFGPSRMVQRLRARAAELDR
jgi:hypothetical protein